MNDGQSDNEQSESCQRDGPQPPSVAPQPPAEAALPEVEMGFLVTVAEVGFTRAAGLAAPDGLAEPPDCWANCAFRSGVSATVATLMAAAEITAEARPWRRRSDKEGINIRRCLGNFTTGQLWLPWQGMEEQYSDEHADVSVVDLLVGCLGCASMV
jgi:hypothetical protein